MARAGKKTWKLFKKHQPTKSGSSAAAAAPEDVTTGGVGTTAGTSLSAVVVVPEQENQPPAVTTGEKSKTGRSWFGRKAGKKQSNKKGQDHNDTFQTTATSETNDEHHEARVDQLDMFPSLQASVPKELEVGLRPGSGDESSRAELEICQEAFVNHGADPNSEGVEASVVPWISHAGDYAVVSDPFSEIRVAPFEKHQTVKEEETSISSFAPKAHDFPSVEPFPAFETAIFGETNEIPRFWSDEPEQKMGGANAIKASPHARHFLIEDEISQLQINSVSRDLVSLSTASSSSVEENEIAVKNSHSALDGGRFEDAEDSSTQEIPMEPSIEAHIAMPAAPTRNIALPLDSEESNLFPVLFPDMDAPEPKMDHAGDTRLIVAAQTKEAAFDEHLAPSKSISSSSAVTDLFPDAYVSEHTGGVAQTSSPAYSKPIVEMDRHNHQASTDSNGILSPSLVSMFRTMSSISGLDAPGFYTVGPKSFDNNSQSSESVSLKWNPSDLESNDHDSKASGAPSSSSSFGSPGQSPSPRRGCDTASTVMSPPSLSGATARPGSFPNDEATYDDVYHDHDDEASLSQLSEGKDQHQRASDDGSRHDDISSMSSSIQDCNTREVKLRNASDEWNACTREEGPMAEMDRSVMNEEDYKLALVKRVSSLGHLSVANSQTVTPVRQNFRKLYSEALRERMPDRRGRQRLPPNGLEEDLSLPESAESFRVASFRPVNSKDESEAEIINLGNDPAFANPTSVSEGYEATPKVDWPEEDAAKVDWPEEEDVIPQVKGSETLDGSIHSDSEDTQETMPSYYKQRTADMVNRRKQARELRKQSPVFVDDDESVKIPGLPFITGIKMGALHTLARDFDCSFFSAQKNENGDDGFDDGSVNLAGLFVEEDDESIVSYDDEDTYQTLESGRTMESGDGPKLGIEEEVEEALKWADDNMLVLCGQNHR